MVNSYKLNKSFEFVDHQRYLPKMHGLSPAHEKI